MVQGHQGVPCRGGVVLAVLAVRVLQRRELILTQHLVHHKFPGEENGTRSVGSALGASPGPHPHPRPMDTAILGELEDVKDKLLHLDPVGLLRLDQLPRLNIHVGDLLLGNVVLQLRLVGAARGQESEPKAGTGTPRRPRLISSRGPGPGYGAEPVLDDIFQEGGGEVVVGDVAGVEKQPPIWAPLLRRVQGDLAVLHHLVDTVHAAHHADWLRGVGLLHHLPKEGHLGLLSPPASQREGPLSLPSSSSTKVSEIYCLFARAEPKANTNAQDLLLLIQPLSKASGVQHRTADTWSSAGCVSCTHCTGVQDVTAGKGLGKPGWGQPENHTLAPQSAPFSRQNPMNLGSATFTRMLSTQ